MRVTDYCVGELSALDVAALIKLAKGARRILEFGVGGSTTIWSQFAHDAKITCVETNPEWVDKTRDMCCRLYCPAPTFLPFDGWRGHIGNRPWFDLVFIDSISIPQRIEIAKETWDLVMPEGKMVWHDTHQTGFGEDVFHFLAPRHLEVGKVERESAVTIVTKCVETLIGSTDGFEGRQGWESGHAPLPADWPRKR